jgi:hypothetical protein
MSGSYGQSGDQNQGSDNCSIISSNISQAVVIDFFFFIFDLAGYDQSQSNRGQFSDNTSASGGRRPKDFQSSGGQSDTQGYGGGAYDGGDQCVSFFLHALIRNAEIDLS